MKYDTTKSQEVCPEKEKIASDILKVWYPNDEYKKLDGSELILLGMKCNAVAEYVIATCQGTGKAQGESDREKIFSAQALLAAAEEGRREGRIAFIRWVRKSSQYKLMQKKPNGKYYENLLESDWQALMEVNDG